MKDWPIPKNVSQLRGFLGLAGFYRRFVPHYAAIAFPLTKLLRKDAFMWSPDAADAFSRLKTALTSTPVLALPNFNETFVLQTDASSVAVGAVLLQKGHPIAYFSKPLQPRMQLASAYAREMFAITEAVRKWRQYLLGRRFLIETDHQSLRALMKQAVQTPEQQMWIRKLLGFDFSITHKPGRDNAPADAFSRMAFFMALQAASKPILAILEALKKFLSTHLQSQSLMQQVLSTPSDFPSYEVRNDLLWFKKRIWIPLDSGFIPLILHEYHSSPVGGHAGIHRTIARIVAMFYWPSMRKDIKAFVQSCLTCQIMKPSNQAPQGLLQPLPTPEKIWSDIAMDFITSLPISNGKTTIWVVVDRLSKYAHFMALPSSIQN